MAQGSRRALLQNLRDDRPPPSMALYVSRTASPSQEVLRVLAADPSAPQKVLLVGARGGGKSTELRAVHRAVETSGLALVADVDLDASGVTASSLSAFDLLYTSGLALLRHLPDPSELFGALGAAYAGSGDVSSLGTASAALEGLAGFYGAAAGFGDLVGAGRAAGIVAAGAELAARGLRLLPRRTEVVAETSAPGRNLLGACSAIARAVREAHERRPLCVLLDGLEKMDGRAAERFSEVFEQTRLLANAPWMSVVAAPPCTLTATNAAAALGYHAVPVWGFPDEPEALRSVLEHRMRASDLRPEDFLPEHGLERVVQSSGGSPRDAIRMLRQAVIHASQSPQAGTDVPSLAAADVQRGIDEVANELGRVLDSDDIRTLLEVLDGGDLPPRAEAARLFADGRILAAPPLPGTHLPRFSVHPALRGDIERRRARFARP